MAAAPAVVAAVAAAAAELGDDGRVLLRPSGTEQIVRVMVEAPTQELAEAVAQRVAARSRPAQPAGPCGSWVRVRGRLGSERLRPARHVRHRGLCRLQQALDVVLEGLRRLEYRGYDSSGVAVSSTASSSSRRAPAGSRTWTRRSPPTHPGGIAGTHRDRAHPLGHPLGRRPTATPIRTWMRPTPIAVIHNGIIENFAPLRTELEGAGVELRSETDTEVVAHLLAAALRRRPGGDLAEAMRRVCRRLEGAFTLVAVHLDHPGWWSPPGATRRSCVGVGAGENFLASDVAAFIEHTREAVELGQDQVVAITAGGDTVTDFAGAPPAGTDFNVTGTLGAAEKGGYDWFMLKEIHEQPAAVADTLRGRLSRADRARRAPAGPTQELRDVDKVSSSPAAPAYHSGLVAKYAIEHWTRIPCEVELASEFRYRDPVLDRDTLVVAISQSGETDDTLRRSGMRGSRRRGCSRLQHQRLDRSRASPMRSSTPGPAPRPGSPRPRRSSPRSPPPTWSDCAPAQAPRAEVRDEIGLCSRRCRPPRTDRAAAPSEMDPARALCKGPRRRAAVLFLGRHVGYPVALEGALKLKELAYMHAEGFAAGELKHGPIALIEEGCRSWW